jgi:glycosyltransferase involved in cell wall biosynthesis
MLINLAYLLHRPTGTTNYALNILPFLKPLNPCFLATPASGLKDYYPVPDNMTAGQGIKGHFRRLLWTQFQLPQIYQAHNSQGLSQNLLFSPIPEAPLYSQCRFVVTIHDLIPLRYPDSSKSLQFLYRHYVPRVLKSAQHIICNSQATADDLVTFYNLSVSKITPILLAYEHDHFQPLNLPRKNYFLVLGRHAPYKNIAIALQAFSQLKPADYELWIAGPSDPRYTPGLQAQAQELGIQHQLKFLNYVDYDQLPVLLNEALALIFPSLWEGFGLPVLEAMACGTPVIASTLQSVQAIALDTVLWANPLRAETFVQAMHEVIRDESLRAQLSLAGLQRAQQFSWQKTGQETLAVLQNFL